MKTFKVLSFFSSVLLCFVTCEFTFKAEITKTISKVAVSVNTTVAGSASTTSRQATTQPPKTTLRSNLTTTASTSSIKATATSASTSASTYRSTLKASLDNTTLGSATTTSTVKPTTAVPPTLTTSSTTQTSTVNNPTSTTAAKPVTRMAETTTLMPSNGCYCVTNGSCSIVGGNASVFNDGSGQIDLRIVNPASSTNATSGTTDAITSPISSGIPTVVEGQTDCSTINSGLDTCCPANGYQCGNVFPPMSNSIALPGRAKFGEFPWQGIILTSGNAYVGSCVLIDQWNVLTVVHRLNQFPNKLFKVRFGAWDISTANQPLPTMDFNVARVTSHPGYVASTLINDIAVLRLQSPVPLGRYPTIGTACLPAKAITTNLTCFISGWGRNDFIYGSSQTIQRKVDVTIVSKKNCQTILRMTRLGNNFILDKGFMCAGGVVGKDACTGDGGAPLVCQVAKQWYAVGLVSWGISCGQEIPGVYMDINNYIPWIQNVTSSPCATCGS